MSEVAYIAGGKRELTKVANRQSILDAARDVFSEMGYETATVRDIVRRTGLASGTFYNYFKSKEEVFEALSEDGTRRFRPILQAQRIQADDFQSYLRGAITAFYDFMAVEHQTNPSVTFDAVGPMRETPEMLAVFAEVRSAMAEVMAHEHLPMVDLDFLAAATIAMARDIGHQMLRRSPIDTKGAAEFAVQLILGGIPALPRLEPSPE